MSKMLRVAVAVAAMLTLTTPAGAAEPGLFVFGDTINDGGLLAPDFTPGWQDLVAGYIGEDADTMSFTWEVADLGTYVPETVQYYWDFALAPSVEGIVPCGEDPSGCFSVGASLDATGPSGTLEANCVTTGTLVQCELLEDAEVIVTVSGNQVTATVRRSDLGSPPAGTILYEVEDLFLGISAFTKVGLSFGSQADQADMCYDAEGTAICEGYYTLQAG
jgi:hypothetical protein